MRVYFVTTIVYDEGEIVERTVERYTASSPQQAAMMSRRGTTVPWDDRWYAYRPTVFIETSGDIVLYINEELE